MDPPPVLISVDTCNEALARKMSGVERQRRPRDGAHHTALLLLLLPSHLSFFIAFTPQRRRQIAPLSQTCHRPGLVALLLFPRIPERLKAPPCEVAEPPIEPLLLEVFEVEPIVQQRVLERMLGWSREEPLVSRGEAKEQRGEGGRAGGG